MNPTEHVCVPVAAAVQRRRGQCGRGSRGDPVGVAVDVLHLRGRQFGGQRVQRVQHVHRVPGRWPIGSHGRVVTSAVVRLTVAVGDGGKTRGEQHSAVGLFATAIDPHHHFGGH